MEEKTFKCSYCSSQFIYLHNLKIHETKKHNVLQIKKEKPFQCSECIAKYSRKDRLIAHMIKKHNVLQSKKDKLFQCSECNAKFSRKDRLSYHTTIKHNVLQNKKFNPFQYLVPKCSANFFNEDRLNVHMTEKQKVLQRKKDKPFQCLECSAKFTRKDRLCAHLKQKHSLDILNDKNKIKSFECTNCNDKFATRSLLTVHMKQTHSYNEECCTFRILHKCPHCILSASKKDLLLHYKEVHSYKIQTKYGSFPSVGEFEKWKITEETQHNFKYIKESSHEYITTKGRKLKWYFSCHRNGYYRPRGNNVRHLKIQGSKKINSYCPASIKITVIEDGTCSFEYVKTHVGHNNPLCHLTLTKCEQKYLAAQIASRKSFEYILDEIKNSVSEKCLRIHLLSRKDLHNIKKSLI